MASLFLKIACKGACYTCDVVHGTFAAHGQIRANSPSRATRAKFSATRAMWFVWYTNNMLQLVLARGLSGRDMGNTNLEWALCGHVLFSST